MRKIFLNRNIFYTFCFIFLLVLAIPVGCASGLKIKIYYSRPDLGGIVRLQDKEVISYPNTEGYRCINPSDWEAILNYLKACQK